MCAGLQKITFVIFIFDTYSFCELLQVSFLVFPMVILHALLKVVEYLVVLCLALAGGCSHLQVGLSALVWLSARVGQLKVKAKVRNDYDHLRDQGLLKIPINNANPF